VAAIPATIFYNKFASEVKSGPSAWRVRRRILGDSVTPDRRARLEPWGLFES
jgi:hypothetical protein